MKKYEVRDYTMEEAGFLNEYTSDLFDTREEAENEIAHREYADRVLGVCDEYYIKEVEVDEKDFGGNR